MLIINLIYRNIGELEIVRQLMEQSGISMNKIYYLKIIFVTVELDILMKNQSDIQPNILHSDTQGQNVPIFGI